MAKLWQRQKKSGSERETALIFHEFFISRPLLRAAWAAEGAAAEPSARVRFRPLFPNKKAPERELFYLERVKGIEPSYSAWEAAALPLSYTREVCFIAQSRR